MDHKLEQGGDEGRPPLLTPEEIEALMAGPVRDWPSVIVVGDEDVTGYDPPRPPPR